MNQYISFFNLNLPFFIESFQDFQQQGFMLKCLDYFLLERKPTDEISTIIFYSNLLDQLNFVYFTFIHYFNPSDNTALFDYRLNYELIYNKQNNLFFLDSYLLNLPFFLETGFKINTYLNPIS